MLLLKLFGDFPLELFPADFFVIVCIELFEHFYYLFLRFLVHKVAAILGDIFDNFKCFQLAVPVGVDLVEPSHVLRNVFSLCQLFFCWCFLRGFRFLLFFLLRGGLMLLHWLLLLLSGNISQVLL